MPYIEKKLIELKIRVSVKIKTYVGRACNINNLIDEIEKWSKGNSSK